MLVEAEEEEIGEFSIIFFLVVLLLLPSLLHMAQVRVLMRIHVMTTTRNSSFFPPFISHHCRVGRTIQSSDMQIYERVNKKKEERTKIQTSIE